MFVGALPNGVAAVPPEPKALVAVPPLPKALVAVGNALGAVPPDPNALGAAPPPPKALAVPPDPKALPVAGVEGAPKAGAPNAEVAGAPKAGAPKAEVEGAWPNGVVVAGAAGVEGAPNADVPKGVAGVVVFAEPKADPPLPNALVNAPKPDPPNAPPAVPPAENALPVDAGAPNAPPVVAPPENAPNPPELGVVAAPNPVAGLNDDTPPAPNADPVAAGAVEPPPNTLAPNVPPEPNADGFAAPPNTELPKALLVVVRAGAPNGFEEGVGALPKAEGVEGEPNAPNPLGRGAVGAREEAAVAPDCEEANWNAWSRLERMFCTAASALATSSVSCCSSDKYQQERQGRTLNVNSRRGWGCWPAARYRTGDEVLRGSRPCL